MIPKAWYAVDQFPRLPSAKIDRRFLQNWVEAQEHPAVEEDSDWEEIDPRDEIAIRVAREVTKLVKKDQSGSYRDVPFSELGVDSIRALSLKRILETAFKVKVKVEQLIDGNARPTGIAEIIRHAQSSNIDPLESTRQDLNARLHELKTKMAFLASQAPHRYAERAEKKSTVFLTGSGGFLGLEILGQLRNMGHPVVALMRDSSMEIARNRLVESARARGLWFEQFEDELECWPGDLSKPYLGLSEELWARLSGTAPERCIEGIVHNGAVVHWTLSAEHLFPVNVDSTVWLLEACLKSPHIRHFSYISGGERGSGNIEEQLDEAHDGYTKTKLFSEALVQKCASITPELHNLRLSIIKPGFIIGKPEFGFANRRDFLWRFIKSVMELGVYDKDATEVWTYVSTDEFVAKVVIEQAVQPKTAPLTSLIEEGTSEGEIWDTLNESYGLRLEPVDHTTWVTRVKSSIESGRESHPLWPLQEVLEQQQYGLGSKGESARRSGNERGRLKAAFLQNVRSLEDAPGTIE
jgi:thioester reductase-like protein